MSFSSEFDALREMRRADDPTLDQGAWVTDIKRADWAGVLAACSELLTHRCKDLRLAGWYCEAASMLHGDAGLADGLALYAGLVRDLWDDIHPQPEDPSSQEQRIGSIVWLLALVQQMLRTRPLQDLAQARRALAALNELQGTVDARLGGDGPAFVAVREACEDAIASLERQRGEVGEPRPASWSAASETQDSPGPHGLPASRAQALLQLRQVAEFFRRTEPHSPVAYLAERAASWGEMPLHAWLRAVMKDGGTLAQLEELLGVPPPADSGPR